VPGPKKGFNGLWIGMWKLNRMMKCVRNIGRRDADSTREHHLQDLGLRLKGGILERRPSMTTGNNELRVLELQSPNRLNVAGFHCALDCQQLFPSVRPSRDPRWHDDQDSLQFIRPVPARSWLSPRKTPLKANAATRDRTDRC
jgi:type II secretory pathway component PulJ